MCLLHVNQSKRTPEFYTFGKVKANSSISHTQVRVCEEELTLQEEGHKQHFDKKFDKALAAYDVLTNTTDSYLCSHTSMIMVSESGNSNVPSSSFQNNRKVQHICSSVQHIPNMYTANRRHNITVY